MRKKKKKVSTVNRIFKSLNNQDFLSLLFTSTFRVVNHAYGIFLAHVKKTHASLTDDSIDFKIIVRD